MKQRIYLDHAASTPLDPRVLKAMQPYLTGEFGNPGSLHSFGQAALGAVDKARETIVTALHADFREVIFTGSATEANNLFLRDAVSAFRNAHPKKVPRVIISAIEHESVLETARDLERQGVELIVIPVNRKGIVDLAVLKDAINEDAAVVSIMYVNNETGVIQPLAKVKALISGRHFPLFHTDASQAFQLLSCLPAELGVDAMTFSGHKIYGPKGVGALYIDKKYGSALGSVLTGGGQEFGLRSGTENVPMIAGFGKAVALAEEEREARRNYIQSRREHFLKGLKKIYPKIQVNGDEHGSPHILNLWIPGHSAEDLLMRLDLLGIAVSSGSACRSRSFTTSHVLEAMGLPKKRVEESIRVSFGSTSREDVDAALKAFKLLMQ